jgi:FkbM family methyltransferase
LYKPPSNDINNNDEYPIGSNKWLLKEIKGAKLFDKLVINSLKFFYLLSRIVLRAVVGKRRRDRIWVDKKINFSGFLYKSVEHLGLDNTLLLKFYNPTHHFKFYSKVTNKMENFSIHDMYLSMSEHEEDILEKFSPTGGNTFVDIGAAFGFYTIVGSGKVGRTGKVISIEPHPDIFDMLNRNIKFNQLTNVVTLNYAVSSKATKVKLYSSYSILPERDRKDNKKFVEVDANTLDNLLHQNGINAEDVNWVKIDVEGAEIEVLRGATDVLSKGKDIALLIEVHGHENYEPLLKLLDSYDFVIEFEKNYEWGDKHIIARKKSPKKQMH